MISFIIERHIVMLPYVGKFIPQTSDVGLGLWSGTGCWRRGGAWAGPYSPPPHHFHFRCRPPMVRTHSETEGQRSRGPEHPPDSEKAGDTGEGGGKTEKNKMDKKEEDVEEQTTRERWETKDGRIKECEWGGNDDRKRASGGKERRRRVKTKTVKVNSSLLEGSGCVKIQSRKHHMALSTNHFHEVIQTKRAFSNQWSLSGRRGGGIKRLHFSESSLYSCLTDATEASKL